MAGSGRVRVVTARQKARMPIANKLLLIIKHVFFSLNAGGLKLRF